MTSKEKNPVSNAATSIGSIYYKDATELTALIRTKHGLSSSRHAKSFRPIGSYRCGKPQGERDRNLDGR
jgi:hypothetical protein